MNLGPRLAALALCAGLIFSAASPAQAKTFKVTTKKDEQDAKCKKNDCSIREALNAASNKTGRDTVKVPKGKYALKLGELTVGSELNLRGAGATRTVLDAKGKSRVMSVTGGPSTISKLTITGGNSQVGDMANFPGDGGGILATSQGTLSLRDVAVVANKGDMSGGGIAAPIESMASTEVDISGSTIARNEISGGAGDGSGGGLMVAGDLTLVNSTIAGNTIKNASSSNRGGGLSVMLNPQAAGGTGVTNVTLTNATIAKNSIDGDATGGMGGGLGLGDPMMGAMVNVNALNTIIAKNKVLGATEDCGMVAMGVSTKSNISSDSSCLFVDGKSFENTNPKLGKLKLNGGQTQTLLPKATSKAVDNGSDVGCPATDQRHVKRPVGKHCDIGSVER